MTQFAQHFQLFVLLLALADTEHAIKHNTKG